MSKSGEIFSRGWKFSAGVTITIVLMLAGFFPGRPAAGSGLPEKSVPGLRIVYGGALRSSIEPCG